MLVNNNKKIWYTLLTENVLSNLGLFSVYALLSLYFLNYLKLSTVEASFLLLFSAMSLRLSRIVFAPIINLLGARLAFVSSLALCAIGYFLMGLTASPWLIGFSLVLIGAGYGTNSILIKVITTTLTKTQDKHFLNFAKLGVATNFGAAIGPLISNYIFIHQPQNWICYFASIVFLFATLAAFMFPKEIVLEEAKYGWIKAIIAHLKLKEMRVPIVLTIFGWFLYAQFFVSLPVFVGKGLMKPNIIGVLFFINSLIVIFASVPLSKLALELLGNEVKIISLSFGLFLLGFIILAVFPVLISVYLVIIIWTVAEILLIPALSALVAHSSLPEYKTVGFTINALSMGIGEGAGNFIGMGLSKFGLEGHWSVTFISLALIALTFILVNFFTHSSYLKEAHA